MEFPEILSRKNLNKFFFFLLFLFFSTSCANFSAEKNLVENVRTKVKIKWTFENPETENKNRKFFFIGRPGKFTKYQKNLKKFYQQFAEKIIAQKYKNTKIEMIDGPKINKFVSGPFTKENVSDLDAILSGIFEYKKEYENSEFHFILPK